MEVFAEIIFQFSIVFLSFFSIAHGAWWVPVRQAGGLVRLSLQMIASVEQGRIIGAPVETLGWAASRAPWLHRDAVFGLHGLAPLVLATARGYRLSEKSPFVLD